MLRLPSGSPSSLRRGAPRALPLLLLLLALALLGALLAPASAPRSTRAAPSWELVWSDEFGGAANTFPDATRWQIEVTCSPANNEAQCYTARTQNVRQNGAGQLVLEAHKEAYGTKQYTSGRINTNGKFTQAYGKFEARMKLPAGTGLWPAFWTLGDDIGSVSWPTCGELDIMENRGRIANQASSAIHGPGYSGNTPIVHTYTLPAGAPSFFADYHIFGMEWEPAQVRFYVDGELHYTVNRSDIERYGRWVFDHPHFMILNLAIGGVYDGNQLPPDSALPAQVLVDWVHVYRDTGLVLPTATPPPTGDGAPYGGTPAAIPGTFQAEGFNTGGQGVAYNDVDPANNGGQYRPAEGVDIEASTDAGGGYNVGWTSPGEWLKYTVDVATAGTYTFGARVANTAAGASFHVEVDGVNVSGALAVPNTGGWQSWQTVSKGGISLSAGQHIVRVVFDANGTNGAGGNYNSFSLSLAPTSTSTATSVPTATRSATVIPSPTRTVTASPVSTSTATSQPSATVPPATPTPAPNLLQNPGFELDADGDGKADGWSFNAWVSRSAALRYSGSYSLRHHSTAGSSYVVRQIVPGIVPGQRYAISGWTNIPATSDSFTYRIEVVWRSASGAALRVDQVKNYSAATGRWVWSGITRLPPAGATSAVVRMNVSSLSATIYADAFAFRQAP